jgi:hypothetical protein
MLSGEAENTNCVDFDLTHLDIDLMINRRRCEQVNYCSFIEGTLPVFSGFRVTRSLV